LPAPQQLTPYISYGNQQTLPAPQQPTPYPNNYNNQQTLPAPQQPTPYISYDNQQQQQIPSYLPQANNLQPVPKSDQFSWQSYNEQIPIAPGSPASMISYYHVNENANINPNPINPYSYQNILPANVQQQVQPQQQDSYAYSSLYDMAHNRPVPNFFL
jgi:hypothetical protein